MPKTAAYTFLPETGLESNLIRRQLLRNINRFAWLGPSAVINESGRHNNVVHRVALNHNVILMPNLLSRPRNVYTAGP